MGIVYGCTVYVRSRTKPLVRNGVHNEIAGFFFSIVGVVYAVLLAFLIVSVWDNFNLADLATTQEAADIVTVARDTIYLPEPIRSEAHNQLRRYVELVISQDWNNNVPVGQGDTLGSPAATAAFNGLWPIYQQLPANADYANALRSLDNLSTHRFQRLMSSKEDLPRPFWAVLLLGGAITIYFGLLFYVEDAKLHRFMLVLLTSLMASCVWLIVVINNPYVGDLRVSPEAMKYALHVIDSIPR